MRSKTWWAFLVGCFAVAWASTAAAQTGGTVTLSPGFMPDPQTLSGVSGGMLQAQQLSPSCRGWIGQQPNHVMNLAAGFSFLRVYVESPSDTTLVIRGPNGQFMCNDDAWGLNPDLDAAYGPGQYMIWVGAYSQTTPGPYTITFSELQSTRPASAAANTQPPEFPTQPTMPTMPTMPTGRVRTVMGIGPAGGAITDYHTTTSTAFVSQPCTVANVSISIRGRHTFSNDMIVRLRSPSGVTDTLQSHQRPSPFRRHTTSTFNGSTGTGAWTLSIEDTVGADSGVLSGFTLMLSCL
ncbi:MAG: proprotein convertase P-domain-containing protein [Deltaproteobacteria bacterium]